MNLQVEAAVEDANEQRRDARACLDLMHEGPGTNGEAALCAIASAVLALCCETRAAWLATGGSTTGAKLNGLAREIVELKERIEQLEGDFQAGLARYTDDILDRIGQIERRLKALDPHEDDPIIYPIGGGKGVRRSELHRTESGRGDNADEIWEKLRQLRGYPPDPETPR